MNSDKKLVLVTGATGQQGGATAHQLLTRGWPVRALTRDQNSPAAQALAEAGAEIVQGDLDDRASLDRALDGAYGVFSVQTPALGVDVEERQGKALADAAQAARTQHVVYSSVGGAERDTAIPHFESKWQIEKHLRSIGVPTSVIRPVYFMDNLNWQRPQILDGTLTSMGLDPDKPLQMIAAADIGVFAALAFENPQEYLGQAMEIAGDELTEAQIAAAFAKAIGRSVDLVPPVGPPASADMARMIEWFNESGYEADIPALRRRHPGLMTFEIWLRKNGWENAT